MIEKVAHDDGRIEIVPSRTTVELLAVELGRMGLSYPVRKEDEETILDHFTDLDAEMGQNESHGLRATRKYSDQVGLAVDEFNILEDDCYIDYKKLNRRLKAMLDSIESGRFRPRVQRRWRKRTER